MDLEQQFRRLIRVAQLIKENPGEWDVPGLAVELKVSEATIHRDIQVLKEYGEIRKLRKKGYTISNFQFAFERFNLEEVIALSLGGEFLARQLGDPLSNVIRSVIRKINDQLPVEQEDAVEVLQKRISLGYPTTRDYSKHGAVFNLLNQAILEHNPVIINYYTIRRQSVSERKVNPYSIAYRRNNWFLIGYCHLRQEIRTFAIQRIRCAKVVETEHFKVRDDFNIDHYLGHSWQLMADGPLREVAIRFDASVAPWILEGKWHPTQKITSLSDGGVLFEAKIAGILEIKRWVLSYGGAAEVLKPAELRSAVKQEVVALNRNYLNNSSASIYSSTLKRTPAYHPVLTAHHSQEHESSPNTCQGSRVMEKPSEDSKYNPE